MYKQKSINKSILDSMMRQLLLRNSPSIKFSSLVEIDTTSISALSQINFKTSKDHTQEGCILHRTSQKYLQIYKKIGFDRNYQGEKTSKFKQHKNIKKSKSTRSFSVQNECINNQNVNSINLVAHKQDNQEFRNNLQKINHNIQIKQLNRPEYRKKVKNNEEKPMFVQRVEKVSHNFISQSQSEQIPILRRAQKIPIVKRQNNITKGKQSQQSHRSVSPKLEPRINAFSSISRDFHTQTDVSVDIDLSNLNFFHHLPSKEKDIQQQEPWQCQQDQIQEELRQINQRLSQRGPRPLVIKNTPRNHQKDTSPYRSIKQPKKVRLSLSPIKSNKNVTPRKGTVQRPSALTPKNNSRVATNAYTVDYLIKEDNVAKWVKPQRNLLTTDIQKAKVK